MVVSLLQTQCLPRIWGRQVSFSYPHSLVNGGITVDVVPLVPVGGLPEVRRYDWASHDVCVQVSYYHSRMRLRDLISWSYIVRDIEDDRLVRAGVSRENERVCHGKGSNLDDFFFIYANLFNQLYTRAPFTSF